MRKIVSINKSWTLFLDRDGVINKKKENDYVKSWNEFAFIEGSPEAIAILSKVFGRIIVVTNQRGVGKNLMTEIDLKLIHHNMKDLIKNVSGLIDEIYYCTQISESAKCRKPNTGMAMLAKNDFPEIDFTKSVVVGDSKTDIDFGKKLGFLTVFINSSKKKFNFKFDFKFNSLYDFANYISKLKHPNLLH